jgi:sugar/nucleoside kinase (ribokinase family)
VGWFSQGKNVLTVGSVHLDTIALSQNIEEGQTEVGSITHSVGGSAYNIAANLAMHREGNDSVASVAVYSILPQHSFLTEIIKYKSNTAGVNSKFLRLYKEFHHRRVRGGGYVGVLDETNRLTRAAVVDAAMHEADIFADTNEAAILHKAIRWADILALDADLAVPTVNRIAEHARSNGKPLFMSIGSEQAGMRSWLHSNFANSAVCVSGRLRVIRNILTRLNALPDSDIAAFSEFVETGAYDRSFDINRICGLLKTKYLVCSNIRVSHGFALLAAADAPYKCFFATPEHVRTRMQHGNSAGVVDGAQAGFIQTYTRLAQDEQGTGNTSIINDDNKDLFRANILDFVEHVSESEGATPGSVVSFEEQVSEQSRLAKLWRLTKMAFDILPVFRVILGFVALIIAMWLIDVGLDVLRYFGYDLNIPDKPWLRMLLRR